MIKRKQATGVASWLAAAALGLALPASALAQSPGPAAHAESVAWSVVPPTPDSVKPGTRLVLTLRGEVTDGWHVYGLNQAPEGPTPLRVSLDPNDVAKADGAPSASPPTRIHDRAFNLETQFYARAFTVTAPVRVGAHLAPGRQLIPLSVRFQTCNGDICQPPKTVHLSAPINVRAEG